MIGGSNSGFELKHNFFSSELIIENTEDKGSSKATGIKCYTNPIARFFAQIFTSGELVESEGKKIWVTNKQKEAWVDKHRESLGSNANASSLNLNDIVAKCKQHLLEEFSKEGSIEKFEKNSSEGRIQHVLSLSKLSSPVVKESSFGYLNVDDVASEKNDILKQYFLKLTPNEQETVYKKDPSIGSRIGTDHLTLGYIEKNPRLVKYAEPSVQVSYLKDNIDEFYRVDKSVQTQVLQNLSEGELHLFFEGLSEEGKLGFIYNPQLLKSLDKEVMEEFLGNVSDNVADRIIKEKPELIKHLDYKHQRKAAYEDEGALKNVSDPYVQRAYAPKKSEENIMELRKKISDKDVRSGYSFLQKFSELTKATQLDYIKADPTLLDFAPDAKEGLVKDNPMLLREFSDEFQSKFLEKNPQFVTNFSKEDQVAFGELYPKTLQYAGKDVVKQLAKNDPGFLEKLDEQMLFKIFAKDSALLGLIPKTKKEELLKSPGLPHELHSAVIMALESEEISFASLASNTQQKLLYDAFLALDKSTTAEKGRNFIQKNFPKAAGPVQEFIISKAREKGLFDYKISVSYLEDLKEQK